MFITSVKEIDIRSKNSELDHPDLDQFVVFLLFILIFGNVYYF